MTQNPALGDKLARIKALPADFHEAGVLPADVLDRLFTACAGQTIRHSAETGSGKSTLLLSWLSEDHTVFTLQRYGELPCPSYDNVIGSELLNRDAVTFVPGPTQRTLPAYTFDRDYDLVLLDGPHGFPFPFLEYYHFYPHIRTGGMLVVDDIHIPVVRFLYEFLRDDDMFEPVDVTSNTAFFRRTDAPTFNPVGDDWWLQGFNRRRVPRDAGFLRRLFGRQAG